MRWIRLVLFLSLGTLLTTTVAAQTRQLADTTFVQSNDTRLYLELRGPAERAPILPQRHWLPAKPFSWPEALFARAFLGRLSGGALHS
jgi:hypothetical protein